MIAIVDYGVGNLLSVQKALQTLGREAVITSDPGALAGADGVILPGVGAFGDAMVSLRRLGMLAALKAFARGGKPTLGICLGMQLLFSMSEEHGSHVGMGLIPGRVRRFRGDFKIPHVGWNQLIVRRPHPLLRDAATGEYVYFVHSYHVEPLAADAVIATADYHGEFPAVVAQGNLFGMQFHPEKSSRAGLRLLANFAALCQPEVPV